jgi:hypothetical protein
MCARNSKPEHFSCWFAKKIKVPAGKFHIEGSIVVPRDKSSDRECLPAQVLDMDDFDLPFALDLALEKLMLLEDVNVLLGQKHLNSEFGLRNQVGEGVLEVRDSLRECLVVLAQLGHLFEKYGVLALPGAELVQSVDDDLPALPGL